MLELIEAVSGRLISPKTWNRNVKIFGARFGQSTDCLGTLCDNLYNKLYFGAYEAGNGHGIQFHKVEPMCVEWVAHRQPTVLFLGPLKTVSVGLNLTKKRPCVVCVKLLGMNGLS